MNELTKLHKSIAIHYKTFKISAGIEEDIKQIKKLNSLFQKLENQDCPFTLAEIVNTYVMLSNELRVENMGKIFIDLINPKYHQSALYLLNNYKSTDIKTLLEKQ